MQPYRNKDYAHHLLDRLRQEAIRPLSAMEVCGTHTVAIAKSGLRELLPKNIHLIQAPVARSA